MGEWSDSSMQCYQHLAVIVITEKKVKRVLGLKDSTSRDFAMCTDRAKEDEMGGTFSTHGDGKFA
jgi:hypothetical protein